MADANKKRVALGLVKEDVEGTYKAPVSATNYLSADIDGSSITPTIELLERNNLTGSIGRTKPVQGMLTVEGSIQCELKASGVPGTEAQYGPLLESCFGSKRIISTPITTGTGHTSSKLSIDDLDFGKIKVGDIILVKEPGAFHVSPVIAVDETPSNGEIELLIPATGAFTDGVVIEACVTYVPVDAGHPTLSVSRYLNGTRLEKMTGARCSSMEISNMSTGQIANLSFGLGGLFGESTLTPQPHTPSYDNTVPGAVLCSKFFMDGQVVDINELSVSIENTQAFKTSVNSCSGRMSSIFTDRQVSGKFNPYKLSDSIALWNKFKSGADFAIFSYIKTPTGIAGEFKNVIGVYLPKCMISELGEADQDGQLQDDVSFIAHMGTGLGKEIYLTQI